MIFDLAQLTGRDNSTGIITADRYLGAFSKCLNSDGMCPEKLFELEDGQFDLMMKEAAGRLTYTEENSALVIGDSELTTKAKSLRDGNDEIISKALAVFETVMSVTDEDRDGDYMHTKGMEVDENMPFLWMHMQVNPIGRLLGITQHDEKMLKGVFALAATKLGEDAATLMELKALRTSIGFAPVEGHVKPRKTATVSGQKKVLSWEVLKSRVMEDSGVSVPSCKDAVITAFSRKSLHHDGVKMWAKSFFDERPVTVPGITLETKMDHDGGPNDGDPDHSETCECKGKCDECKKKEDAKKKAADKQKSATDTMQKSAKMASDTEPDHDDPAEKKKPKKKKPGDTEVDDDETANPGKSISAELVCKSVGDSLTHKMYGMADEYLPGSFEWVMMKIQRMAKMFLMSQGVMSEDEYGSGLVATFANECILCVGPYDKKRCYRVAYTVGENGVPAFSGSAEEVEIKAQVLTKWFQVQTKRMDWMQAPVDEIQEPTAIELARQLGAKMFNEDEDATLGEAIAFMGHAADVFEANDERELFGELLDV